jgi:hypothetical protein
VITINDKELLQYNVTGLSKSTTYYFVVRVYNSDYEYADSNVLNITTSGDGGNGPPVETDEDHDGMDDDWEYDHFSNLDQGAGDDYDGDGHTNLVEFQNGWDPTNDQDPPPEEDDDDDNDDDDDIGKTLDQYKFFIVAFLIVFILIIVIIMILSKKGAKKKDEDDRRAYESADYADQYEEAPYEEETPIYTATAHPPASRKTKAVTSPRTHALPKSKTRERTLPASKPKTLPPASEEMVYEYAEEEAIYEDEYEPDMDIDDEIDSLDMEEDEPPELEEDLPELEEDEGGIDWEEDVFDDDEEDMDLLNWDEDE